MHIEDIQSSLAVKTWPMMLFVIDTTRMVADGIPINDRASTHGAKAGSPCSVGRDQPAAANRPRSTFWKRLVVPLALISRIMAA